MRANVHFHTTTNIIISLLIAADWMRIMNAAATYRIVGRSFSISQIIEELWLIIIEFRHAMTRDGFT